MFTFHRDWQSRGTATVEAWKILLQENREAPGWLRYEYSFGPGAISRLDDDESPYYKIGFVVVSTKN